VSSCGVWVVEHAHRQHRLAVSVAGYDVLLDQRCKPWLLEVNHSPSFSVGSAVDAAVKEAVLLDTLRMVRCVHMCHTGDTQRRRSIAILMMCAIMCELQLVRGENT
jgi:Tubulin-tyrosine ligase family